MWNLKITVSQEIETKSQMEMSKCSEPNKAFLALASGRPY